MNEVKTDIEINAPIAKVWQVLTDFNNYEWNPMLSEVTRDPADDSKVSLRFRGPLEKYGIKAPAVKMELVSFTENERFAWGGPGVEALEFAVKAEHYFELYKLDDNTTRLIHGEVFEGFIPKISWPVIRKLEGYYDKLNLKFKAAVEAA